MQIKKVSNMIGHSGKPVVNQFIISTAEAIYFKSYNSIIVKQCFNDGVFLDENYWEYSNTTSKYRNLFLNETKKETQAKIESGEYKLTDLN
jgi:hypothetical protein